MPLTAGNRVGHYEILAPIGAGGMGEVYRAQDTKLNRDVAIKILPEAFAQDADRMARFAREAQVLASLNHPNIAAIYGVEERALVMELVEGPTLAERIAQGPIPLEEALPAAKQIAEALEYAHERGVVHRDLKPANLKITSDGRVKVLDFGLAKALSSSDRQAEGSAMSSPTLTMRATQMGVIMGTAAYMSPEQARGVEVDRRADIWAFGVVLFEILTGRHLFTGESVSDTLAAVLKTDPDWSQLPQETPEPIRRLLRRSLQRDRKRRLPDIGGARLEIDEAMLGPAEPPAVAVAPQPRGLSWWWAAAAFVCALAAIAGWGLYLRQTPLETAPVRYQIYPPEKATFGGSALALSPDGRQLAYVVGKEGRLSIWMRALDSLAAREISGTEGGQYLFWSPDSRYLGFHAGGKLKKVEVAPYGLAAPQTIAEIEGRGAAYSWNRDGIILFGSRGTGILRVSQAGGVPTPVMAPERLLSPVQTGSLRPWFLPDGKHFLYFRSEQRAEDSGTYIASLDGKSGRRIVTSTLGGIYAPPSGRRTKGHLLYLRERTLMAQPLDPVRYDPAGEPFPVAEQIGQNGAVGWFSVSTNGVLAYRAGDILFQLTWFDRAGKKLGVVGPPADYGGGDLALSRDGKMVAASSLVQNNRDIWVMDAGRGVPTRLTFDRAQDGFPVWSPDGSQVVFSSSRDGVFNLYRKTAGNTGVEEPLLKSDRMKLALDWSADGKFLLYSVFDPKSHSDLWVLPMNGETKPVPFLTGPYNENQGQFSPTPAGSPRWVVYNSDESGRNEIYVQSFPSPTRQYRISTGGGEEPRWRRDGKEIYYVAADGELMAVEVRTEPQFEIVGTPKPLFGMRNFRRGPLRTFRWAPAPDGQRFLLISEPEETAGSPITVVLNWEAAVKR